MREPAVVEAEIHLFPKISLHDHLDGAVRPQTLIELAQDSRFDLPAHNAEELRAWFVSQSSLGSLADYLRTFATTTGVMQTHHALRRVACEYVHDIAADNIIYGEVRWAPEQHLLGDLSLDDAVGAVQQGLEQGMSEVREHGQRVRVGQILSAMRQSNRVAEIAELALRHRGRGVIGFDIAGPEANFPARIHRAVFSHLASEFFPVTIHAGEGDGISSIRSALLDGRALRLGHGTRIAEDIDWYSETTPWLGARLGQVAEWVRDRRIALEISPSSNLQTGTIAQWGSTLQSHPFHLLYRLGFAVTVNTDNRLQSGTTLTHELALLAETFGYGVTDMRILQVNAAEAAFVSADLRDELISELALGFASLYSTVGR